MALPARATERSRIRTGAGERLTALLAGAEGEPHFELAHRIELEADPARAFAVTDAVRLGDFASIRLLFWLRRLDRPGTTRQAMNALGFPTRRDEPGRILSFLGGGRLWSRRRLFDPFPAGELAKAADLEAPRRSIAIWAAYELEALGPGRTLLTQTTKVRCSDRMAWLLFGAYWIVTRPFLGLIRVVILGAVRRRCAALR